VPNCGAAQQQEDERVGGNGDDGEMRRRAVQFGQVGQGTRSVGCRMPPSRAEPDSFLNGAAKNRLTGARAG
jgi:hypothetical protein